MGKSANGAACSSGFCVCQQVSTANEEMSELGGLFVRVLCLPASEYSEWGNQRIGRFVS